MRAEHVNAFLVPSVQVIEKMAGLEVKLGKVSRIEEPQGSTVDHHLSIIIGLKGRVSGSVILSTPQETAVAMTGRITGCGAEAPTEEDVRAVMAEVANTIVGNATGRLYDIGVKAGITPPTVVLGPQVSFGFDAGVESVQIPLITEVGNLQMVVSLTREEP